MLAGVVCAVGLGGAMLMGIGGGGLAGVEWGWSGGWSGGGGEGGEFALHWGCIRRSMKTTASNFQDEDGITSVY